MKPNTLSSLFLAAAIIAPLQAQVPATTSATYAADGSVTFIAKLPSGQQYVEVFARQNGVQNIAQSIAASGIQGPDGMTTYAFKANGYKAGDVVEYRFYSYLPASAGVFTPGPVENAWATLNIENTVAIPAAKDASLYRSSYWQGDLSGKNYGSTPLMAVMSYLDSSDAVMGFDLGAVPSGVAVTGARLVLSAQAAKGGAGSVHLNLVNDSASWNESTVTYATEPASTLAGTYTLPASGQASLDVTALVSSAVGAGHPEISFLLTPAGGVFYLDARENASGQGPVLEVSYSSAPVLSGYVDTKWYVYGEVLRSCYLNLGWTAPAGFEGTVDHYELYTTSNGGATWDFWSNAAGNAMIRSWSPNQHATVSIVAVGTNGARSARSAALSI